MSLLRSLVMFVDGFYKYAAPMGLGRALHGGRIVFGNEAGDVAQILAGTERPDYLEIHDANSPLTC